MVTGVAKGQLVAVCLTQTTMPKHSPGGLILLSNILVSNLDHKKEKMVGHLFF